MRKEIGGILTETEKLAAVESAEATTLPLSPMPSRKALIIKAFIRIIKIRPAIRGMMEIAGHI